MDEIALYRQHNPRVFSASFNPLNRLPGSGTIPRAAVDKAQEYSRVYYQENRERLIDQSRVYYQENRGRISEQSRVYYQENRERIIDQSRVYYQENRERISERRSVYYQENRDFKTIQYTNMVSRHKNYSYNQIVMTREEFINLYNSSSLVCALSGVALVDGPFNAFQWYPDRIDTSQGYVVGNVRVVALELNVHPTYSPQEQYKYCFKSLHDIERSPQELQLIEGSLLFAEKARFLLTSG